MKNIHKSLIFVLLLLLAACSSGISEKDYSALQQEYAALQEENANLKSRLEDAEQRNSELLLETERTAAALAEAQRAQADAEAALEEARQAQADAEAALEKLKAQAASQPAAGTSDSSGASSGSSPSGGSNTKSASSGSSQNVGTMVWVSKTGKKYHSSSSCSNMKNPSQVSLSTAKSRGLTACKKCY